MMKFMIAVAVGVGALAFAPQPVAADAECTRQYNQCLNDSWDLEGWSQTMADIECFAEYTGCVAKKVTLA